MTRVLTCDHNSPQFIAFFHDFVNLFLLSQNIDHGHVIIRVIFRPKKSIDLNIGLLPYIVSLSMNDTFVLSLLLCTCLL